MHATKCEIIIETRFPSTDTNVSQLSESDRRKSLSKLGGQVNIGTCQSGKDVMMQKMFTLIMCVRKEEVNTDVTNSYTLGK